MTPNTNQLEWVIGCLIWQIYVNGQVLDMGRVVKVSNHSMVRVVLGILCALVIGAVLAFLIMKHLRRKKKKGKSFHMSLSQTSTLEMNYWNAYPFSSLHAGEPPDPLLKWPEPNGQRCGHVSCRWLQTRWDPLVANLIINDSVNHSVISV